MRRNTPLSRRNGGFTLIEMLIVVAIIAILVAVSIPMVGNALERARVATDAANERAFKAELLLCFLNNDDGTATGGAAPSFTTCDDEATYAYDAVSGKLKTSGPAVGYGKCTQKHIGGEVHALMGTDGKPGVLYGGVSADGQVYLTWAPAGCNPASVAIPPAGHNNIHGIDLD